MKIRSVSELSDTLDSASAWRTKELSVLRILIATRGRASEQAALRRSAVPMLYGHWEGFTKHAATAYLELVRRQQRLYRELKSNFLAIAVRGTVRAAADAAKSRCTSEYLKKFGSIVDQFDEQVNFSGQAVKDVVSAESNLSSRILQDILDTIDIPYDQVFRQKALLIDGSLLENRNRIAHGESAEIDSVTYVQLHDLVIELINHLKDVVVNRARDQQYLST